jgi:hypothetical protein
MADVAVLFARSDSVYKTLAGCDVYDKERDALTWPGGCPVVAHPPCRLWGPLRHFAKSPDAEAERAAALWAVSQVRTWGGALEHPQGSKLWRAAGLPLPGGRDAFSGFTLAVSQWWWGHKADKLTWLYICGVALDNVPPIPFKIGEPEFVVQSRKRQDYRPHISKAEREHTPRDMALWLLEVARRAGMIKGNYDKTNRLRTNLDEHAEHRAPDKTLTSETGGFMSYEDVSCPKCGATRPTCCACKLCPGCGHLEHEAFKCVERVHLYTERRCFGPGQGVNTVSVACTCAASS